MAYKNRCEVLEEAPQYAIARGGKIVRARLWLEISLPVFPYLISLRGTRSRVNKFI